LNIVVLTKLVPDTTAEKRLNSDGTLDRTSVPVVLNPWDEFAIEEALRIRDATGGGEVVLLVMAPEQGAPEAIRKALAMGADRAVLISDPALHGSDLWATGHVLAAALKKLQYDLVLSGSQSSDAGGGLVYGIIAAELGLPQVSWINEIEVAGNVVRGKRISDVGHDVIEAQLPALASVTQTAHEPRYPTLPNIMKAKRKEIAGWTQADTGVPAAQVGLAAAHTTMTGSERPQTQRTTEVYRPPNGEEAAKYIADFLERRKLL